MLNFSTARRAACSALLALLVALPAWTQTTNRAPQIVSQPERLATVKVGFSYAVRAEDTDGDALRYLLPTAPTGATIDSASGRLQWRPRATDLGLHPFVVAVEDGHTGRAEQRFDLKVVEDFCPIYPIALPKTRVDGLVPGALIDQLPRGTGPGNFSWLTWSGAVDAPTMARSLTPPGDSDTYVDPDDATDHLLNIGDWAQGSTGSMNSAAIRAAMDVLKTIDIILPVWDETRGQGSHFDYHVQRFVTVRLRDYQLTGHGWLSFEYKGEATCYNRAPTALPQTLTTDEDVPLPITLTGTDPENDALTYTLLDAPTHGTLSGTPPALVYTPAPGYFGNDSFTFRVNDGQLDSPPARIDIRVLLVNRAPTIVTPPRTVATEGQTYRYDVDAVDPDRDVLAYSLDRTPTALAIAPPSGVIEGVVDATLVQPVRAFNAQCYVIPEDAGLEDPDGTIIAPLFQRVRRAIAKGSDYAAPATRTWHQRHGCLGCHVQNQTLLGLQGSMERAKVDEATAEYLLAEILASQQSDGSIRRSHPEHAKTQTAFALWALSYVPDHARTFVARERALRFFQPKAQVSGNQTYWQDDHQSGWLRTKEATTALIALGSDRFIRDAARQPSVTPAQVALALELRNTLPQIAEFFLARSTTTTNNQNLAFTLLGLAQTQPHLDDAALRTRVEERIALLNTTLRARQHSGGGWPYSVGGTPDALTAAWVGFALDTLDPPLTDPVVLNNIEFLLDEQRDDDGTWRTTSGLFSTHLGTTGLVMAYLPIALEHLGNPDLTLGHMKLEAQSDGRYVLSAEAMNRGLADVNVASTVSFFLGREAAGTALGQASTATLRSGETRWVSITLDALPTDDVSATIQAGGITECLQNNNATRAALTTARATDPYDLFDTQSYLVNLEDANAAPTITSEPVTAFEQGRPYTYQVTVADPDVGDAHEYELRTAPTGLFINPLNGRFSYDLAELAAGTHTVTVRVTDLRGAFAEQTFQLVIAPNHPPEITSTPVLRVYLGETYRYDVDATDADNDTLRYRFDGASLTMNIDAETGVITWTPLERHLGDQPVTVLVDDGRGGTDRQTYTIRVETKPVNRPPTITTTPPASVDERATYRYDIDATDPDNDVLAYRATQSPAVTDVVAATGALSWLTSDTRLTSSVRGQNLACRLPSESLFDPVVRWTWSGSSTLPAYDQVMNSPVVVPLHDSNGDGRVDGNDVPDVAFVTYGGNGSDWGDGVVRLVRGSDGQELFTLSDPTARVPSYANLAAGDLDGDGIAEIVAPLMSGGIVAINRDGTIKWKNTSPARNWNIGGASIADLDADGSPEIVLGRTVYSAAGQIKWQGSAPYSGNSHVSPIATFGIAADLRAEPGLEVLAGPSLYSATGTLLWRYDVFGDGATAIGDLNQDGKGDVVVVGAGKVVALDANGAPIWGPVALDDGGRGGPPTIADFDGDGRRDIGVAGRTFYFVFGHDGRLKWKQPIVDVSSNITGSTLFDFDGDGAVEVMQADEKKFRVFDGATGTVRLEMDNSNGTAYEYPVVADADRDGSADILLVSNMYYSGSAQKGVRMISSASRSWMPTRSIWNQHAYHIDNINDDGTVPRQPAKSWLTHNSFRLNTFADRHPLGLADLALFDLRLVEADGSVKVLVVNRGLAPTTATTTVRIYNGDPTNGGTLLGTLNVPALAAGEEQTLTLSGLAANAVNTNLFARVDEAGAIDECLDDNNETAAAYFDVRATDPAGLFDAQRFTVTVANVNEAPSILTTTLPSGAVGQTYRYVVQASDPDLGDGLRFELAAAPVGLSIEAVSGELRWTPTAANAGTHTVRVRVIDVGGLSAERSLELVISTNQPPQITTTPTTSTMVGTEYRYDVDATDAEGETLTYALTVFPTGMQIDAATGLIRWAPAATGSHEIEVRVSDARGAFALQRYTLAVNAPANHPPAITSTPSTTASPGRAYTYLVDANDPDNDVLSVLLPVKPTGMSLNELTGQISWTPTASQLGTHAVQVQVTDGRGGTATQNFNIVVSEVAGNQPPSIVSTPVFTGEVGREYRYAVVAQDPNGDALTYSLVTAPTGMTIAANGQISWTPSATGSFPVRVRVADAQAYAEQSWSINVLADLPLNAVVTVTPTPVQPGGTVTIQIVVEGAAAQPTVTATLDGQTLPLDPDGTTTLTAPTTPGDHPLIVTVTDGSDTDTTTSTIQVVDPSDTINPTAQIHSPREGATEDLLVLTSPRDVVISVADDHLSSWRLALMERGAAGAGLTLASGSNAVSNQTVAKIDPTLLMNGQYALVLNAADVSGNTAQDIVGISIEGAMKLGHFSITFEDLNLPVSGIPVSVARTYDTRQRHRLQDFGMGWSLAYQNVRIFESRRPGFGWEFKVYPSGPLGLIPNYCMESALGNVVSITLADGKVEKFRPKAVPECNQVLPLVEVSLVFEPMSGTHGKLKAIDDTSGRLINGSIAQLDAQDDAVDPDNYLYTDKDGVEYTLDQNFGLRQVVERANDNTITFGRDGIQHSNGTSVDFVRDAAGRIIRVLGPAGTELGYEYDADGDLIGYVDAEGERTRFTYLDGHYLQDIIDPRGVRVSRNEYDDDGRLVAVIDADGNRIEYTHDLEGRVEQVKDRNGGTLTYVYNDRGDVLAETNALGKTQAHTYDANGNELSRTDAIGRIQRWTYDGLGNVLTDTNGAGEKITHVFGSFNHLISTTDHAGNKVLENTWRNIQLPNTGVEIYPGPLVAAKDALGGVTSYGYDADTGELNRISDPSGGSRLFEPDGRGYAAAETNPLGHRTTYVNDDLGRVLESRRTRTRADGSTETLVTSYAYDGNGNLVQTTHPDGSITRAEHDAAGQQVAEIDALGRRTEHVFDDRGHEVVTRYPDGTTEEFEYDANDNLVGQVDRGGRLTVLIYDRANRLVETIHPDADAGDGDDANNPRSRNVYDDAGQLIESIDETGQSTKYQYDAAGRRTHTTLASVGGSSATIVDEYDSSGRRVASTDAEGHRSVYRYDAVGRLIESLLPDATPASDDDNPRTRYSYDAAGRKTAETDPSGRTTRYAFDAAGQLVAVVLPNPTTGANPALVNGASPDAGTLTTRYVYDEVGNKVQQIDAEGRITRWEFDALGRETARVLPEGQRETKVYNAAGELVTHTDFNGETTRYSYDGDGRTTKIDYPSDADVVFGFALDGERSSAVDGRGTSTRTHDRRGRLLKVTDADGGQIEYTYDDAGNLLSRVSPSQSLVYAYDARHRLSTVTRSVDGEMPVTTRYEYDQDGNRRAMVGGDGVRTEYGYDRAHRLTSLAKRTAAGVLLFAMQYTVDPSGMRTAVAEQDASGPLRAATWEYDAARRLTKETVDHRDAVRDRNASWSYDKVGNRLTQVVVGSAGSETTQYAYDRNDRLLSEMRSGGSSAGTTSYTYDANGNTKAKTAPGGATTYSYDDANRLLEARAPDGTTSYVYDADGLRVRSTHAPLSGAATTAWYVQDAAYPYAQVVEEYRSSGAGPKQLAATFTFADDLVSQSRYDAGGMPTTRYVHADGFGSTRWLTDASAAVTDAIEYDAFGNELARSGTTDVEHLYRGEAFDPNVGFYYLRARWYDPSAGRFTSLDPWSGCAGCPLSLNKYLYADANPINGSDPSGLMTLMELQTALNTQIRNNLGATQSYRIVFKKTGCLLIEAATEEVITHGVYVFLDGFMGGAPYVGKTKNEFVKRLRQHAAQGARQVQRVVALFGVSGGKAEVQVIEQLIFDLIKPVKGRSNTIRPLSETRPDKAKLRKALSKIKLCK